MTEINMLPYYAEALAAQEFLKVDIEKIYATNRFQFYDFEKQIDDETFFIGRQLPLEKEEIFRKIIGIFLYSKYIHDIDDYNQESKVLDSNIQALFKKGYKKVYNATNLYSRTHTVAKVDEIASMIFNEKPLEKYSAEDTVRIFSAILFMSIHMFEDYKISENTQRLLSYSYKFAKQKELLSFEYNRFKEVDKRKIDILYKQVPKHLIEQVFFLSENSQYDCFSNLYAVHDLSPLYDDYPITDMDIKDMLTSYWYVQQYGKEKCTLSIPDFIIAASHIKILLKAYKSAKDYYFSHNQSTMFIELEQKEMQLKILAEDLQSKNSMLQSSKKQLSNMLDVYNKKNADLERKIKKLEAELDKARSHDNELQALRELAFSFNQDENEFDVLETREVDYKQLKSIDVLVVGGNLNWQKKLKEKLPEWKYINASIHTFDKALLKSDLLVLNTNSMNHSLFYFIMDNISKDVKLHFVSRTNIEDCITDIYESLNI